MDSLERVIDVTPHDEVPSPTRGIAGVRELAARRFSEALTLVDLATAARMPTNTLTRRFNRAYGTSPMRWLWAFRTVLAAEIIAYAPTWSLTEISVHCGFGSSAHFSRRFRQLLGESPTHYKRAVRRTANGTLPQHDPLLGARSELIERAMRRLEAMAHRLP